MGATERSYNHILPLLRLRALHSPWHQETDLALLCCKIKKTWIVSLKAIPNYRFTLLVWLGETTTKQDFLYILVADSHSFSPKFKVLAAKIYPHIGLNEYILSLCCPLLLTKNVTGHIQHRISAVKTGNYY